jgi:cytochrome c2
MGYPGVQNDADRRNLIAYIELMSRPKATAPAAGAPSSK